MPPAEARLAPSFRAAAIMVENGPWSSLTLDGTGACVPIAFCVAHLMGLRGIAARPIQAGLRIYDPLNLRWAEIHPESNEPAWPGHMVVLLPTFARVVDASLAYQPSRVLRNLDPPVLQAFRWDGKSVRVSAQMGRGRLEYDLDKKGREWKSFNWPWRELRQAVDRFHAGYREEG